MNGDSKREAILGAALHVFAQKGFHPATIDEIAERAGVGKGTVYSYFESKADLMEDLIEAATTKEIEAAEAKVEGVSTAMEQLHALAHFEREHLESNEPLYRLLASDISTSLSPQFQRAMEEARLRIHALVATVIARGQAEGAFKTSISPDIAATLILGLRASMIHYRFAQGGKVDADDLARQTVEFILRGLTGESRDHQVFEDGQQSDADRAQDAG